MADQIGGQVQTMESDILTGDNQLSKPNTCSPVGVCDQITEKVDKLQEKPYPDQTPLPNGFLSHNHGKHTETGEQCRCNQGLSVDVNDVNLSSTEATDLTKHSTEASKLCIPNASGHENCKKHSELTDSSDSGVHSGTDNGSDSKSSSSSPGLSAESSVQDLCEKSDLQKCHSIEELTDEELSVSNEKQINQLAESVSNTLTLKSDVCEGSQDIENGIEYVVYESELQMPDIMKLITKDLSEPYSIYTYRYFIHNWPKLCFLAMEQGKYVGAIVCKLDMHKKMVRRGYIAMLAVDENCRRKGIGSHLVLKAIHAMIADDCDEVVLETEITNKAALHLYENLGFVRDKRLFRYYLNGVDALRLKLWLR